MRQRTSVVEQKHINDIFQEYFEIIDSYFGSIKHYLQSNENSHIDLGAKMAHYPLVSDLIIDAIDDIDNAIDDFWRRNTKTIVEFIRSRDSLRCIYSGDITPTILENFVKKSALYIDSIILPDPVFNLTLFQKQIILDKKYYLQKLIRHVFNIWKLKDLILANLNEKIIFILPISLHLVNTDDRQKLISNADQRFTEYISKVFDEHLKNGEACLEVLGRETTSQSIFEKIKKPDLLPNIFRSSESLHQFLLDFSNTSRFIKFKQNESIGWNFAVYLRSQFIRVQEHKYFCDILGAEPIYDYELPWFFFNYEVGGVNMDAAIANVLQKESFNWINRVPLPAIKILREEDKLDYMRALLRQGITDLKAKKDTDLVIVAQQIEKNLQDAFKKQDSEIGALQKQVSTIVKKDVPIIGAGLIAGFIPYISNIVSLVFAGRDIAKALKQKKLLSKQIDSKQKDFINLLIKSYERKG